MSIYLDNAATSFPKAPGLGAAVADFIENCGRSTNRGSSAASDRMVREARLLICRLFNCHSPKRVIFTSGATMSINMLLYGLLKNGDHVVVSSMEHHAVMRPLLLMDGAEYTSVQAACDGSVDAGMIEAAIRPNTRLILLTHASNVCGTTLPIYEAARIAKEHGIFIAVDCAQTAGVLDIDAEQFDFIAFSGHKGLMGPQGTGGFVISEALSFELRPHLAGGTGSYSHMYEMPPVLPDRFEAGTPNMPGIAGLKHSLEYVLNEGVNKIRKREEMLTERLLEGLEKLPVRIIGRPRTEGRVGTVSFVVPYSNNFVIAKLLADAGIELRFGLHCAPMAHESLGTRKTGTLRVSPGYFTKEKEIDEFIKKLEHLV